MFKNLEKRKIYGTILGVIGFILLALSISYAFYLWNSNDDNTNVNLTISKGLDGLIIYNHGNPILSTDNVTLTLGDNYTSGISTTIEFWKKATVTKTIYGQLSMKILDLQTKDGTSTNNANIAKCETVKWAITTYTTTNTTETLLAEGNFKDRQINDVFSLVTNIELNPYQTYYKVYIWLDSSAVDGSNPISGELISTLISAEASDTMSRYTEKIDNSGANYPVLTDGLIPVVYNGSNWVKADVTSSTSTYGWYDYDQKKWANAVLVSEGTTYANDLSGNNNIGKLVGTTISSGSLSITNDASTYVELPSNIGATFPATYSVTFTTTSKDNQVIFGDYHTKAALGIYNNATEFIVAGGNGEAQPKTFLVGGSGLSINTTYTVDIVYRSFSDLDVYLNGKKLSASSSVNYWTWGSSTSSFIGKRPTGSGNFGGTIKRFIVYNDALTAAEVASNYSVTNTSVCGNGIVCDNLKLYYNFASGKATTNSRAIYSSSTAGTTIADADILAFYVWIPRYKYKVWNMSKQIGNSTYDAYNTGIDIVFEDGTSTTGTISCTYNFNVDPSNGGINLTNELAENCTDPSSTRYYTHPAFTFGDQELKGFWMGKFELSSETADVGNTTSLTPRILPNVTSWRGNTVSDFWKVIYDMQTSNNIYGLPTSRTNADSHMITNMEWGAVAYLTNSKYGRCTDGSCTEVTINNCSFFTTGIGADAEADSSSSTTCTTAANKYNGAKGALASTTGNITGVYDMSGGAHEHTMGNASSKKSTTYTYYAAAAGSNFTYSTDTAKYITTYAYGTTTNDQTAYNRARLGDATSEVVLSTETGWNGDNVYVSSIWFNRGGAIRNGASAGIFFTHFSNGYMQGQQFPPSLFSTRAVLTVAS